MNGTTYRVHQACRPHVVAARRRLAPAAAMPMATWHKTTVSGHPGAMSILFGIDDATTRQPMEASP
jgi:hypothetical protein